MTLLERTWAVVVGWNSRETLSRALESLVDGGVAASRTVLVDNASTDGSPAEARGRFPDLVVIQNARNLGFGAAANQGAREALARGARAVFFLNDDAWLEPGALPTLAAVLAGNPRVGAVGPRILFPGPPARVWAAGGVLGGANLSTLRGNGRPDGARWQDTVAVDYVPGCALLARAELLEELDGFEEAYFAYMEDVELGVRSARSGWLALCVGEASCRHDASRSTGRGYSARRKYMNGVNAIHFLRTHGRPVDWARLVVLDVLVLPFAWIAGLPRGRGRAVLAKGLGMLHGALGRRVVAERLEPGGTALW